MFLYLNHTPYFVGGVTGKNERLRKEITKPSNHASYLISVPQRSQSGNEFEGREIMIENSSKKMKYGASCLVQTHICEWSTGLGNGSN